MATLLTRVDVAAGSTGALLKLGTALDELSERGHLDDGAARQEDERHIPVSRTYLWLLGFLKRDNGKHVIDRELRQAIAAFQSELGMPADGRLDDITRRSLYRLTSFDQQVAGSWLTRLAPELLARAVHLRLFSYGLLKRPPPCRTRTLTGARLADYRQSLTLALEDFVRLSSLLGFARGLLTPGFNAAVLALLFDHNRLVQSMPVAGDGFRLLPPHPQLPLRDRAARTLVKGFISNLALVELWLLGYDVRPGNFSAEGPHGEEGQGSLFSALDKFARDRRLDVVNNHSIMLGAWFFREVHTIQQEGSTEDAFEATELDALLHDHQKMASLEKVYKTLGARLFDGIKRAVSWVKGFLRKALGTLQRWLRNIARVLHRSAAAVYRQLQAIVRVVVMGFDYFFRSPVPGSDTGNVHIRKTADFDMVVSISSGATAEGISAFFSALDLRLRAMRLGGRFIAEIWRLVQSVIEATAATLGWLGLLFVLVKLGMWGKRALAMAEEAQQLLASFPGTEASVADQIIDKG
ncbi:MAG: peptidoglycan-binding domain-containing protein [Pseudomonadales bacterium]|nr:peptidoglycan-binding domain-containing protein [Pseudomonadales bacterium]